MTAPVDSPPARNSAAAKARFDAIARLPFGLVGVRTENSQVSEICFLQGEIRPKAPINELAQRVVDQLAAYCTDSSTPIDLPLAIEGTDFQRRVWEQIAGIPSGSTATYGELARRLNAEARAVGQACGDNRLPLAIPCHRVVGASGIGGFAHHRGGAYEAIKRWLLLHEASSEFRLT